MSNNFKKLIAAAVLCAMLITSLAPCAFAEDAQPLVASDGYMRAYSTESSYQYQVAVYFMIEQMVKEALLNGEKTIDLLPYELLPGEVTIDNVLVLSPYFSAGIDIKPYYIAGSYYSRIDLVNPMTPVETAEHFARVDKRVNEIRGLLAKGSSDLDKALIMHDLLVYEGEYDYDRLVNGTVPSDSYRSAGILMDGLGVCQSYAYAFMYFMMLEGIECHVTRSDAMAHAWNIIKIDGEYYHVDVTWDDPTPDKLGKARHYHFLLSDEAVATARGTSSSRHRGWDRTDLVCDSKKYDDAYWTDIDSRIIAEGGYSYYVKGENVYKKDTKTGAETAIANLGIWYAWGNPMSYWKGKYSGLFAYGGAVYYNTSTEIRKIDMKSGVDSLVYAPDTSKGYVYGSALVGGELVYTIGTTPNEPGTKHTTDFTKLVQWESISVNHNLETMSVGSELRIIAIHTNGSGTLRWSSSNQSVATVTEHGLVTAVGAGIAVITVTADSGLSASCVVVVLSHAYGDWSVTVEPTCTEKGEERRVCILCNAEDIREIEPLGHDLVTHYGKEVSCTEIGWDAFDACLRCRYSTYQEIPPTGHNWTPWQTVVEPTEAEEGEMRRYCDACRTIEKKAIPSLDHVHEYSVTVVDPTCTDDGYTLHKCACGDSFKTDETAATGHDYTESVTAPSCTEKGYVSFVCDCGDNYKGNYTDALGHDFADRWTIDLEATYSADGEKSHHCSRCEAREDVIVIPKNIDTAETFGDIANGKWYKSAVDYAWSNGLMSGVGGGNFGPDQTTSRAMIVTVLWRMAGEPVPHGENPFTDFQPNQTWYHDAVIWASENGIVSGRGGGIFDPTAPVTRQELAVFLHNFAKYMEYEADAAAELDFPDAAETAGWAKGAVQWAVAEEFISGKSIGGTNYLSPLGKASRAEVAAIFMRYCRVF